MINVGPVGIPIHSGGDNTYSSSKGMEHGSLDIHEKDSNTLSCTVKLFKSEEAKQFRIDLQNAITDIYTGK